MIAASAALFLLGASLANAPGQTQGPGIPWKVLPEKIVLATGLPCIYQKEEVSPTTVVGIFVVGGKSAVTPGLDGLASLVTRLALEIPDEGKVRDLMAQATRMSFFCLEDCSVILIECLSENLEEALSIGAKIIQDPLLTGLRIGRAKEIMEIYGKVEGDEAANAANEAVMKALFAGQGYGTALYGTEASLKAIVRKDVLSFYGRYFTKRNLFFCVETDLEREPVQRLLEKSFAGFPEGQTGLLPLEEAVLPADRTVSLKKETKQNFVGRAYVLPRPDASILAKGFLLETLLGKGPGSRLWGLRIDERLAYNVDANLVWTRSAGILTAYLETSAAKSGAAGEALDRTLADLREKGVTEEEFATARTMSKARFLRTAESKASRLRTLGLFEVLGLGPEYFSGFFGAIDAVKRDDLNAFLSDALAPDRALRVTVGPGSAAPAER
jgi:zinc protease